MYTETVELTVSPEMKRGRPEPRDQTMATKTRKTETREDRMASMEAFRKTMWIPKTAAAAVTVSPAVFEMDAETARRWAIVRAAR